jgi:hypothetical protein
VGPKAMARTVVNIRRAGLKVVKLQFEVPKNTVGLLPVGLQEGSCQVS